MQKFGTKLAQIMQYSKKFAPKIRRSSSGCILSYYKAFYQRTNTLYIQRYTHNGGPMCSICTLFIAAQTTIAESPEEYFNKKFGSFTIFFITLLVGNDNI